MKQPLYTKWWFWLIISIIFIIVLKSCNFNSSSSFGTKEPIVLSTFTFDATKCETFDYKTFCREPYKYEGSYVKLNVVISQACYTDSRAWYRCYTYTPNDLFGYDSDEEFVIYDYRKDTSKRLLNDDIIEVYGIYIGNSKMERLLTGETVEIPSINLYEYVLIEE